MYRLTHGALATYNSFMWRKLLTRPTLYAGKCWIRTVCESSQQYRNDGRDHL